MSANVAVQDKPIKKSVRLISLETFHRLYSNKEDGYKYEWNNGIVEKTPRTMNRSQLKIARKLTRLFSQTKAFRQMGELAWEVNMFLPTTNRTRIADLAYLTSAQIEENDDLKPSKSDFIIEIVSKNDTAEDVRLKLEEYFKNDIKVVWVIYQKSRIVEVYTSPSDVKICSGTVICSATPVLPDFNIAAQDLFN